MSASRSPVEAIPRSASVTGRRGSRRAHQRYDEAVIQAEVRRLARALAPFGMLHDEMLRRASGGQSSRRGGSDDALSAAVGTETIQR